MNIIKRSTEGRLRDSVCVFILALTFCLPRIITAADRPNIVFILTNDMGYSDPGCYGGKFAPTPNIDRLAKEGIRFTHFYDDAPICSPSRAAYITGMFPARWNFTTFLDTRAKNLDCEQADFLPPSAPAVARVLKAAGYYTAHYGKWHLGGGRDVKNAPPFSAYGYDEHVGTYESPEPDPNITATNWIWSPKDKVKRWERTRYFVDHALDFLRRHKDGKGPCYVEIWPDDVHTPWVPNEKRQTAAPIPRSGAISARCWPNMTYNGPAFRRPEIARRGGPHARGFHQRQRPFAQLQSHTHGRAAGEQAQPLRRRRTRAVHRPLARPHDGRPRGRADRAGNGGPFSDVLRRRRRGDARRIYLRRRGHDGGAGRQIAAAHENDFLGIRPQIEVLQLSRSGIRPQPAPGRARREVEAAGQCRLVRCRRLARGAL